MFLRFAKINLINCKKSVFCPCSIISQESEANERFPVQGIFYHTKILLLT